MSRVIVFVILSCLTLGCENGFTRKDTVARMQDSSITVNDADVAFAQVVKPQLKFPCRIAVCFSEYATNHDWRWTAKDKAALEGCGEMLIREKIASDVFIMSPMFVNQDHKQPPDMKALRVAAAKHGADVLFVITGSETTWTSKNPIAVMNLTVLGGFFLPGSQCDSFFTMQAGLVDVNNGCLYMSLESEGEARIYRPTFIIEEKDAIEKSKSLAVKQFASQLVNRVRGLRDSVIQGEPSLADSIRPVQEVDPKTRQQIGK